jgi:hypothetical protein
MTPLNLRPISRYILGSISKNNLYKILHLFNYRRRECIKASIPIHKNSLSKAMTLILLLKTLNVKFVTLKELASMLESS